MGIEPTFWKTRDPRPTRGFAILNKYKKVMGVPYFPHLDIAFDTAHYPSNAMLPQLPPSLYYPRFMVGLEPQFDDQPISPLIFLLYHLKRFVRDHATNRPASADQKSCSSECIKSALADLLCCVEYLIWANH